MKKSFFIFTFVIALLALATIVPAQRVKDTPVTSVIEDADQASNPFSIRSDLHGPYKNGTSSVVSRIQSIGDWELNMLSSATRRVSIDFGDQVGSPLPSSSYPVRFLAQCPADLRNLGNGNSQLCKMVIAVDYGSERYSIRFGYVSGTTQPLWTCKSAVSGKCNSWRMASDPNGAGNVTGELLKITTVRGKNAEQSFGKYYFSFGVNVTNP